MLFINTIAGKIIGALKKMLSARVAGWICAGIIALAAFLSNKYPGWADVIGLGRDTLTNIVVNNEHLLTNAIGQIPEEIK